LKRESVLGKGGGRGVHKGKGGSLPMTACLDEMSGNSKITSLSSARPMVFSPFLSGRRLSALPLRARTLKKATWRKEEEERNGKRKEKKEKEREEKGKEGKKRKKRKKKKEEERRRQKKERKFRKKDEQARERV